MPTTIGLSLSDREFLAMVRQRGFITPDIRPEFDDELIRTYLPILRKDMVMLDSYGYRDDAPLDIPISVFGSRQDRITPATGLGSWRDQTRAAFSLQMFDGDHFFPRVEGEALLAIIREQLTARPEPAEQPREDAPRSRTAG
jgi:surfactin synthase thioesterase subunit